MDETAARLGGGKKEGKVCRKIGENKSLFGLCNLDESAPNAFSLAFAGIEFAVEQAEDAAYLNSWIEAGGEKDLLRPVVSSSPKSPAQPSTIEKAPGRRAYYRVPEGDLAMRIPTDAANAPPDWPHKIRIYKG